MLKLKKIMTCKKISITILLLILILINIILNSKNEITKKSVSQITLNNQNKYKLSATVNGVEWYYDLDNDGNAINVHYKDGELGENVIIPQTLDTHPVVEIKYSEGYNNIFGDNSNNVKTVKILEGVTNIGSCAFSSCTSLNSIEIPESLTCIEYNAFIGCSGLKSIKLPEGLTRIESYAFKGCSSLTSIIIPSNVIGLGSEIFSECSSLKSVEILGNLTYIGGRAFEECTSLISIVIPEGVTSIGTDTFYRCKNLISVTLPEGVTSIGDGAFGGCSSLTGIKIPSSVTNIGIAAFSDCSGLTNISIPKGVTSIEYDTFFACSGLTSVSIPEGVTTIGRNAFSACTSLTSIEIPEGVTTIGEDAFSNCSSLTSITIPESITNIEKGTFAQCYGLKDIKLPSNLTSIGNYVFWLCKSLSSIEIPEGLTSIGDGAFLDCAALMKINIPKSVISIAKDVFTSYITIYAASDYVANYAEENNINYVLDKTPPEIKVEGNPNNWVRNDITLSLTITDSQTEVKSVSVNGQTVQLNNGKYSFTVTKNQNYTIEVSDKVGNLNTRTIVVDKIDKEKPSLSIGEYTKEWTKEDITLNISTVDNISGIANVKVNGNAINLNNGQGIYNVNKNGEYTVVVTDNAGNTETRAIQIDNIDKDLPTLEVTGNPSNWTKENIILNIETTDGNGSGIGSIIATDSKGTITNIDKNEKKYTVAQNGSYTIKVTDNAGNEKSKAVEVTKVDKQAPELEIKEEKGDTGVKLNITAVDNEDGIGLDKVTINGEEIAINNNKGEYNITEEGEYEIIATDRLGNNTRKTYKYNIIDLTVEGNPEQWTKEDVNLIITAKKDVENISNVTVNGQKINMTDGVGTYTVRQNGTYEIIATNSKGEKKTETVEVTKIDKNAPIINSIEKTPEGWAENGVNITINAVDDINGSGLAENAYSFDGGKTWSNRFRKLYTKNTSDIVIEVRDKAGNITRSEPMSITNIVELTEIKISNPPDKVKYLVDETFESEGMKVEAVYNDGVKLEISNYRILNGENLELGQEEVTISYTENGVTKTTTQKITVIKEEELDVEVKTYDVVKENNTNYIEKIMLNTSLEEVKRNIETNGIVEIYKNNQKILDDSKVIGTGMEIVIKLGEQENRYTVVVQGDLNGDGKMSIGDLLKLSRYVAKIDKTLTGAYLRASDIKKDGQYGKISDILKMSRVLTRLDNL